MAIKTILLLTLLINHCWSQNRVTWHQSVPENTEDLENGSFEDFYKDIYLRPYKNAANFEKEFEPKTRILQPITPPLERKEKTKKSSPVEFSLNLKDTPYKTISGQLNYVLKKNNLKGQDIGEVQLFDVTDRPKKKTQTVILKKSNGSKSKMRKSFAPPHNVLETEPFLEPYEPYGHVDRGRGDEVLQRSWVHNNANNNDNPEINPNGSKLNMRKSFAPSHYELERKPFLEPYGHVDRGEEVLQRSWFRNNANNNDNLETNQNSLVEVINMASMPFLSINQIGPKIVIIHKNNNPKDDFLQRKIASIVSSGMEPNKNTKRWISSLPNGHQILEFLSMLGRLYCGHNGLDYFVCMKMPSENQDNNNNIDENTHRNNDINLSIEEPLEILEMET